MHVICPGPVRGPVYHRTLLVSCRVIAGADHDSSLRGLLVRASQEADPHWQAANPPQLEVNKITGMMESSSDNETVPQTDSDRHAHGDSDRDSDSGVQVQVELQVLNDSESDHSHWEP